MKLNGLSDLNAYDLILIDGKSYYVMLLTCEDLRIITEPVEISIYPESGETEYQSTGPGHRPTSVILKFLYGRI